ncbi:DNA sulfur modification protein DndB [Priestia aryabhattai]|uniref:DNA sulfur modification protein DndB n=1 Tax=Priestia aryabhattai TaxID=412384 RepID=UPI003531FD72
MKNKELLIESVIENLEKFQSEKKLRNELKVESIEHISPGDLLKYIKAPQDYIPNLDISTIYYLAKYMNNVKADTSLQVDKYFTAREIKEIETTYDDEFLSRTDKAPIELPYTLHNVIKVGEGDYILSVEGRTKKDFMDSHILQYNQETQREAKMVKDKNDPNNIIPMPKVNRKSVREIAELAEKGELIQTMVTWNARLGSSEDESGEELIYNEEEKTLTILKGTLLDVVDGYHRLQGVAMALNKNPNLKVNFKLNILNFSQSQAKKYFAQLNTYNPVSKARVRELSEEDFNDFTLNFVMNEFSDLKERVTHRGIAPRQDALTTYTTLSDAIKSNFNISNKAEAIKTGRYLTKFFKELFYSFPDQFLGDIASTRRNSVINTSSMFAGYVKLAKIMQDKDIELDNIADIISDIDFSRDNKEFIKLGIIDDKGKITTDSKTKIAAYFEQLNLDKHVKEKGVK